MASAREIPGLSSQNPVPKVSGTSSKDTHVRERDLHIKAHPDPQHRNDTSVSSSSSPASISSRFSDESRSKSQARTDPYDNAGSQIEGPNSATKNAASSDEQKATGNAETLGRQGVSPGSEQVGAEEVAGTGDYLVVANWDTVSGSDFTALSSYSSSSTGGQTWVGERRGIGFRDMTSNDFQKLSSNPGPRISQDLLHAVNHFSNDQKAVGAAEPVVPDKATRIIEELRKARNEKHRRKTLQKIQSGMLPALARKHNLQGLARFLVINDVSIQAMAIEFLQQHILHISHREDSSMKDELLAVAKSTQTAFFQGSDTLSCQNQLGCLHLMVVSALCSRCLFPSAKEWAALKSNLSSPGNTKRFSMSTGEEMMKKALIVFYRDLKPEEMLALPTWRNVSWRDEDCLLRRRSFRTARFSEHVALAFTLLNEIAHHGRSQVSWRLLKTLTELNGVIQGDRKQARGKDEASIRFAFSLMLVRGLVCLLNTTFKDVPVPVGDTQDEHTQQMVQLIIDLVQKGNNLMKPETYDLPFHSAAPIKKAFSYLHMADNQPQCLLVASHVQKCLGRFGFRFDTNLDSRIWEKQCTWYELDCELLQKKARLVVLVPKLACLADGSGLIGCQHNHLNEATAGMKSHDRQILEKARCHQQNFDLLVQLRSQCKHVIQLFAYQYFPFPFCITEAIRDIRLIQFLLKHRQEHHWLSRCTLLKIVTHIVEALDFLKQMYFVQRDITTYNMIVTPDYGGHNMSITELLPSGQFVVKLADLSLTHKFTDSSFTCEMPVTVAVENTGPVPCRWTPPEALRYGQYSVHSMVYSVGCVMFELFTHGCQPFTSYDHSMSTEQLLLKILFEPYGVALHHWLCIPNDVFSLINDCMDVNQTRRPSLQALVRLVHDLMEHEPADDDAFVGLNKVFQFERKYPPISPAQLERHHEPEKEIPTSIRMSIEQESTRELYVNTQRKMVRSMKKTKVLRSELIADDWLQIKTKIDKTVVKECVSESFVREVLPKLEANDLPGVKCWLSFKRNVDMAMASGTSRLHEREYPRSINLMSAAKSGDLWKAMNVSGAQWDVESHSGDEAKYMTVFRSLTHRLLVMHEQGFCHCDIRACNILIDSYTGEVMLPRIGRMCHLPSPQGHAPTTVFRDSLRWLPPEVTLGLDYDLATYCCASDIFMLGTTFWEVFNIRQVITNDPVANETYFAPLSEVPIDEVPQAARKNDCLPLPDKCPDWLYDLICECRHPDHAKRPSCQEILDTLYKNHGPVENYSQFWPRAELNINHTPTVHAHSEEDDVLPLPTPPKKHMGIKKRIIKQFNKLFRKRSAVRSGLYSYGRAYTSAPDVSNIDKDDSVYDTIHSRLTLQTRNSGEQYIRQPSSIEYLASTVVTNSDSLQRSGSLYSIHELSDRGRYFQPFTSAVEIPEPDYDNSSIASVETRDIPARQTDEPVSKLILSRQPSNIVKTKYLGYFP